MFRPKLKWTATRNLKVTFGVDVFGGKPTACLGVMTIVTASQRRWSADGRSTPICIPSDESPRRQVFLRWKRSRRARCGGRAFFSSESSQGCRNIRLLSSGLQMGLIGEDFYETGY